MNLDLTNGGRHFCQDFTGFGVKRSFPPCFAFPPLVHQDIQAFELCCTMKRTATEAFVPPAPEAVAKVSNCLTLCVALNPTQFAQLHADQPILPDPRSERFGLRADPFKAAERAHYFMSWAQSQDTAPEEIRIKKYMICKIGLTSICYMHLMENGTLQKARDTMPSAKAIIAGMVLCTAECAGEKISKILNICFA